MTQQVCAFEVQVTRTVRLNYLLYLPKGYGIDPRKKWPLILFLHGMGERGNDLKLVKRHGIPKMLERQEDLPFIVISPQCPKESLWIIEAEALNALLDEVVTKHAAEVDRIYLTGLSMGGYGAWRLAIAHPERFAAVAPICGGGDPENVHVLKGIPIWAFHGAKDPIVPLSESSKMVNALKACGGNVRLTVYPDAEHDSWTQTYEDPALYDWFLRHSRPKASSE